MHKAALFQQPLQRAAFIVTSATAARVLFIEVQRDHISAIKRFDLFVAKEHLKFSQSKSKYVLD